MPDIAYLRTRAKNLLPKRAILLSERVRSIARQSIAFGDNVYCPVCDRTFGRFLRMRGREHAMCPGCGALERHRQMWIFLDSALSSRTQGSTRLLHFAPEGRIRKRLENLTSVDYVSADLYNTDAMLQLDVSRIDLPDESVDAIICSHVLEHVQDDRQAMRELLRILRPGGWAVLNTPFDFGQEKTYEDWTKTSPAERLSAFGQWDHVRIYGRDLLDILSSVGWTLDDEPIALSPEDASRMGVPVASSELLIAYKSPAA